MLCNAGRATSGKIPISTPSNIHPRKAAASTSHCARVLVFPSGAAAVGALVVIGCVQGCSEDRANA